MYVYSQPAVAEVWLEHPERLSKQIVVCVKRDTKGMEESISVFFPCAPWRQQSIDKCFYVHTVPFDRVRRIWHYNVQSKSWSLAYENNEYAGRYIVETEVVKEASKDATDDKADEAIEQSGTVQEEA